jgi:hypothetical protein
VTRDTDTAAYLVESSALTQRGRKPRRGSFELSLRRVPIHRVHARAHAHCPLSTVRAAVQRRQTRLFSHVSRRRAVASGCPAGLAEVEVVMLLVLVLVGEK